MKTEFDEFVRVDCKTSECVYNNVNNCGLKGITIGIGVVGDYPHGIERMCLSSEFRENYGNKEETKTD